jgi:hypothetical protein
MNIEEEELLLSKRGEKLFEIIMSDKLENYALTKRGLSTDRSRKLIPEVVVKAMKSEIQLFV